MHIYLKFGVSKQKHTHSYTPYTRTSYTHKTTNTNRPQIDCKNQFCNKSEIEYRVTDFQTHSISFKREKNKFGHLFLLFLHVNCCCYCRRRRCFFSLSSEFCKLKFNETQHTIYNKNVWSVCLSAT